MRGEGGVARVSANEYNCMCTSRDMEPKINFGDLPPYLTCASLPNINKIFSKQNVNILSGNMIFCREKYSILDSAIQLSV